MSHALHGGLISLGYLQCLHGGIWKVFSPTCLGTGVVDAYIKCTLKVFEQQFARPPERKPGGYEYHFA